MDRHLTTESSHLSSLRRCGVCIMLLATLLLLASSAYADKISIGLQEPGTNSGHITTIATGPGNVSISGISYGTFKINDVSATDFALLGKPGLLNSDAIDISTAAAGTLTIWVTTQGLFFKGAQNFVSSFAVNALDGSVTSVTLNTLYSKSSLLYGGTQLTSALFHSIGTAGPTTTSASTGGFFSVTQQYEITDSGNGTGDDNLTIDLKGSTLPVPEPASFGLMGIGLAAIAAVSRRRRTIQPVEFAKTGA